MREIPAVLKRGLPATTLGLMVIAGCSAEGRNPDKIAACQDGEASNVEAILDSERLRDNPDALLEYAQETDREDQSSEQGLGSTDFINGLGELICKTEAEDGQITLYFLEDAIEIREAFISEGPGLLETVRDQQSSTSTTRLG